MLFDVQAALAEILKEPPATVATPATSRSDVATVAGVAAVWRRAPGRAEPEVAPPAQRAADPPSRQDEASPYGVAVGGRPMTWTGKVVSLAEWRALSEWERHGPGAQHWDGVSRTWREPHKTD